MMYYLIKLIHTEKGYRLFPIVRSYRKEKDLVRIETIKKKGVKTEYFFNDIDKAKEFFEVLLSVV